MPLKFRRFCSSLLLVLFSFITLISAQTVAPPTQAAAPVPAPTSSGDIMRERISKAKAFIAVKNFNAAIYELESLRKETNDPTVRGVTNVLLMNSYLEQGDYKRAQDFLKEFYDAQKPSKPDTSAFYFSIAGQVVRGAKNQLERYRALGLSVSDRNLPLEAVADIEKMRETLELVVAQSRTLGKEKTRTASAMAMIEEASNTRSILARDDYDARRWKDEMADAREEIANSRSVIMNAVNDSTGDIVATQQPVGTIAANIPPSADNTETKLPEPVVFKPVADSTPPSAQPLGTAVKPQDAQTAETGNREPERRIRVIGDAPKEDNTTAKTENPPEAAPEGAKETSPLAIGSLIAYATKQAQPIYPVAAKNMRMTGLVKVEVVVNESGEVAEVQTMTGPSMLQGAAKDAIRKWRFKPFVRDGQPVKATGFVNFNFAL